MPTRTRIEPGWSLELPLNLPGGCRDPSSLCLPRCISGQLGLKWSSQDSSGYTAAAARGFIRLRHTAPASVFVGSEKAERPAGVGVGRCPSLSHLPSPVLLTLPHQLVQKKIKDIGKQSPLPPGKGKPFFGTKAELIQKNLRPHFLGDCSRGLVGFQSG